MNESVLLGLAAVVFVGMSAQWLAWRLRLPSILLLLVFGFLAGPVSAHVELGALKPLGTRFIDPDAVFGDLLFPVVSLFVGVILFEGGLSLSFGELEEIRRPVRNLMSVGVVVTWLLSTFAAQWLLDLDIGLSLLFGAILTVTGPTVIGPLLRHVRPSGRTGPILKWEGIVNDPIGAMLSVLVFEAIMLQGHITTGLVLEGILLTLLYGIGGGFVGAFLLTVALRRYWIPDFLHSSVALAAAVAAYAGANALQHESGLLAVTVMGVALANQKRVNIKHIVEFKENLRVLFISVLFILLSARLDLADLRNAGPWTLAFVAALIFVIRPASVFLSSIGTELSMRERLFLSWMAPRGVVAAAVASVFALRIGMGGGSEAERLVPLMFVVIVGTVSVYGLTSAPVARWLGLSHPNPQGVLIVGAHRWARDIGIAIQDLGFRALLVDTNWANTSAARMAGLPTYYGSALSEYAMDEMNLDGVGQLFAMTPNDEVNSLAAMHFAELFGRSKIYQLATVATTTPRKESSLPRGRRLFGPEASWGRLDVAFQKGYRVKATPLSESFDPEEFERTYSEESIPLFVVTEGRQLHAFAGDQAPKLRPGQTLVALVPREEERIEAADEDSVDSPEEAESAAAAEDAAARVSDPARKGASSDAAG